MNKCVYDWFWNTSAHKHAETNQEGTCFLIAPFSNNVIFKKFSAHLTPLGPHQVFSIYLALFIICSKFKVLSYGTTCEYYSSPAKRRLACSQSCSQEFNEALQNPPKTATCRDTLEKAAKNAASSNANFSTCLWRSASYKRPMSEGSKYLHSLATVKIIQNHELEDDSKALLPTISTFPLPGLQTRLLIASIQLIDYPWGRRKKRGCGTSCFWVGSRWPAILELYIYPAV